MSPPRLENPLLPRKGPYAATPYIVCSPTVKACFIDLLRAGFIPSYAARELKISIHTLRRHRAADPEFKQAWDESWADCIDELEENLIDRALHGTQRPIVQKGERVYERNPSTGELILDNAGNPIPVVEHVYPDNVALAFLKAYKRNTYGDQVKHDVSINTGVLRVPETIANADAWEQKAIDVHAEVIE